MLKFATIVLLFKVNAINLLEINLVGKCTSKVNNMFFYFVIKHLLPTCMAIVKIRHPYLSPSSIAFSLLTGCILPQRLTQIHIRIPQPFMKQQETSTMIRKSRKITITIPMTALVSRPPFLRVDSASSSPRMKAFVQGKSIPIDDGRWGKVVFGHVQ